jgi:hypothetical protein
LGCLNSAFHSGEMAALQSERNMFLNPYNDTLSRLSY